MGEASLDVDRLWPARCIGLALLCALGTACASEPPARSGSGPDPGLLSPGRQLTFEGRRSGEGYFSADGRRLVFQSEREPGNPFYQIYLMDLQTGDVTRVSPGHGKTTCGWLHPDGERVLFASTHEDPDRADEQRAELELRASGRGRRYEWDYDPDYDLYAGDVRGGSPRRLTNVLGYDAEGSYSPDGQWIAFASNRHAFAGNHAEREAARAAPDPSLWIDIYIMRADGSGLRRLTETPGYDGGPFFSPDGTRIVWRRFSPDGLRAEIYTMALDGSDVRQLTSLGAMSWAPFYHPSGEYVVFTTNLHGMDDFELYVVDAQGSREPLRVTRRPGFDGLPVFAPGGGELVWTSTRTSTKRSQLFRASWDHAAARARLLDQPLTAARPAPLRAPGGAPSIRPDALRRHVEALTREEMAGRATGTPGELIATEYVARVWQAQGLEPAGDDGSWFHAFEFTAGVTLGSGSVLAVRAGGREHGFEVDREWRPLALSKSGDSELAPVVFAGYGIVLPDGDGAPYDAYSELDVRGKWVLLLRFVPEDVDTERRQKLSRYAGLRYKAMLARERGALGVVFVTGPHSEVKDPLVRLAVDAALAGSSLFALSVDRGVAERLLADGGRSLSQLQAELDAGDPVAGFELSGVALRASINLVYERGHGRNVIARLRAVRGSDAAPVVVGAHVDHLRAASSSSLARGKARDRVHPGADDNASGVAALLEISRWLAPQAAEFERDVLFAAWSGEELGLLGSNHWVAQFPDPDPHGSGADRPLAAYLNMDMVGRLDGELVLHGAGSSSAWTREIEGRNVAIGLPLSVQLESYLPTDATSFYLKGVPILSAFTGSHEDYHTPADTADKLDYEGTAEVARLIGAITRSLAESAELPDYVAMQRPEAAPARGRLRVYLGTIPDYALTDVTGVALSGVVAGGPAQRAGLRRGDVIVQLAGMNVENIYDYTYVLEGLAVGEAVAVHLVRDGERVALEITPDSRE